MGHGRRMLWPMTFFAAAGSSVLAIGAPLGPGLAGAAELSSADLVAWRASRAAPAGCCLAATGGDPLCRIGRGLLRGPLRACGSCAVGAGVASPVGWARTRASVDARRGTAGGAGLAGDTYRAGGTSRAAGTCAARSARQSAEDDARRGSCGACGGGPGRRADTAVAVGAADRGPPAGHHGRRFPRRAGRDPGRGQPACRQAGRCAAGNACGRSVCGCGRQDAGAGDDDAEPRSARRLRRLGGTSGWRGPPPSPRRCSQRRAPSARGGRQMGQAARGELRSGAGGCALHRHRHVAAQPRRAVKVGGGRPCRTSAKTGSDT